MFAYSYECLCLREECLEEKVTKPCSRSKQCSTPAYGGATATRYLSLPDARKTGTPDRGRNFMADCQTQYSIKVSSKDARKSDHTRQLTIANCSIRISGFENSSDICQNGALKDSCMSFHSLLRKLVKEYGNVSSESSESC